MGTIDIYINRTKVKWFVALFLFMLIGEIYAIGRYPDFLLEGLLGFVLFGGALVYLVYLLTVKGPSVVLSQVGITSRIWRGMIVYWDNIAFVEVRGRRRNRYVLIQLADIEGMSPSRKRTFLIPTKTLMISPYELCELLQLLASVKSEKRQEIIDGILAGVDLSLINIR